MKIICPKCKTQNIIYGIVVVCIVCQSVIVASQHDDLPHSIYTTTPINNIAVEASGTASNASIYGTSLINNK